LEGILLLIGLIIMVGVILCVYLLLSYYPPLGAGQSTARRREHSKSKNYAGKGFVNAIPTSMAVATSHKDRMSLMTDYIKGNPNSRPTKSLEVTRMNKQHFVAAEQPRLTWFGHSASLLQLDGKTFLLDPMFGKAPSPVPLIGGKRYSKTLPFEIEQLPIVDAVIISHDHYDHLDYGSIIKLKSKVKRFIVPLGVAPHLIKWGIDAAIITEHDWWDELTYEGINLTCTPARHFSGRSLTDRNATLWCSWVIRGQSAKIFFSGDSGYGPHFKEIGDKYGPFDLTLMECGQYNEHWASIHMFPEETVQAHLDVRGNVMIPIHWGAFTLSLHAWTDPVERAVKAAKERNVTLATPRIGETVHINTASYPVEEWWNKKGSD